MEVDGGGMELSGGGGGGGGLSSVSHEGGRGLAQSVSHDGAEAQFEALLLEELEVEATAGPEPPPDATDLRMCDDWLGGELHLRGLQDGVLLQYVLLRLVVTKRLQREKRNVNHGSRALGSRGGRRESVCGLTLRPYKHW
ncbi:hypothetical protein CRUP_004037 [Coryphaenoides rupestris]|nr:hypothetical protein CRUP_004037 [Coryphaenoides rupestris]